MNDEDIAADRQAIRTLIERQFAHLSWNSDRALGWDEFAADFLPDASCFPAARPVRTIKVPDFVEKMKSAASTDMPVFEERLLGAEINPFGTIAVVLAVYEQREARKRPVRAVEALLLIKDGGVWRIAAQGWDKESGVHPIPAALLD